MIAGNRNIQVKLLIRGLLAISAGDDKATHDVCGTLTCNHIVGRSILADLIATVQIFGIGNSEPIFRDQQGISEILFAKACDLCSTFIPNGRDILIAVLRGIGRILVRVGIHEPDIAVLHDVVHIADHLFLVLYLDAGIVLYIGVIQHISAAARNQNGNDGRARRYAVLVVERESFLPGGEHLVPVSPAVAAGQHTELDGKCSTGIDKAVGIGRLAAQIGYRGIDPEALCVCLDQQIKGGDCLINIIRIDGGHPEPDVCLVIHPHLIVVDAASINGFDRRIEDAPTGIVQLHPRNCKRSAAVVVRTGVLHAAAHGHGSLRNGDVFDLQLTHVLLGVIGGGGHKHHEACSGDIRRTGLIAFTCIDGLLGADNAGDGVVGIGDVVENRILKCRSYGRYPPAKGHVAVRQIIRVGVLHAVLIRIAPVLESGAQQDGLHGSVGDIPAVELRRQLDTEGELRPIRDQHIAAVSQSRPRDSNIRKATDHRVCCTGSIGLGLGEEDLLLRWAVVAAYTCARIPPIKINPLQNFSRGVHGDGFAVPLGVLGICLVNQPHFNGRGHGLSLFQPC